MCVCVCVCVFGGMACQIIKNSWGKEWGLDGYFQMGPIGENMCGIATCSSYPVLADPSTADARSVLAAEGARPHTAVHTA